MRTLALPLLLALAVPAAGSSPDPKRLAVPPEDLLKAQELVRQLGSDDFPTREAAHDRLAKMGRLAKPALIGALGSNPDPEVRSRCRELLPKAAADDLKARLAAFLADTDGKFDHDLPGWNEFRKVAGTSADVRGLFNDMMTDPTNRTLLLAVGGPASELGGLVAARKTEMYTWRFPQGGILPQPGGAPVARRDPTPADITALLFAEAHAEPNKVPRTIAVSTLFITPGFSAAVQDGSDKGRAIKAVIVKWLDTRDDPVQMYQAMTAAGNLGIKETSGLAAKLLNTGGSPIYRLNAAYALAKNDAKQYAPALEKALGDTAALTSTRIVNGERFTTDYQVRDAALAALLMLSGQNPEDYGFVEQFRGNATAVRYTYSARNLPEEARAAAFKKWKAWRAKNPDWGAEHKEKGKR